ncbi:HAE1 family hydrophobic/amphiphilic exporter-1 [Capnocytophaga leadbetteri]|uniref:HAE1 family hydrophobic/amphiphilic exporter-1 n=1 Tax=Capnocytophaga leadbetteri TaxID=327575 RepID=A0A2T5XTC7_9FLAO|nr:efflux RND transporter permease subunit [Capnocytophaga leadbetteri]PTX05830.1 HAE1 family hydrophobic/amphiphilic exporter-1 [Capnocytophaga leadbetteri]
MDLIKLSIKRPSVLIVMLSLLLLGGFYSYKLLNYELIPKFEVNVVTISTIYPGASPSEIESTVTKKIEDGVSALENIKKIQSYSYESLSVVVVQLTNDANVDNTLNEAQRKINAIRANLPTDAKEPSLSKFSLSDLPIVSIGVTSKLSSQELYDLVDKKIQPELSRVPGVAQVNIIGGRKREIRVNVDAKKLEGYGLSIGQVQQLIAASNMEIPAGKIKTRENSTSIRLLGKIQDVEQLRNLTLASQNGVEIRLSDVADVQDTEEEAEKIARIDQENTLLLQVLKQTDANAVSVSELVRKKMEQIEQTYKNEGVKMLLAEDTSEFTLHAANSVMFDLVLAIVLVAVVMFFFLHSLRNALIVMVSIPTSLIAAFIGMYFFGFTLNLMSLVALSLVVGILVDDAIVVLENIHRHMEMGKNKVRAAFDGSKEIVLTVMAITLVIVVVFVPISIGNSIVVNIVREFCMTVAIATMLSLLMSFTVVPWLYSRVGKLEHANPNSVLGKIAIGFESYLKRFTQFFSDLLVWVFANKWKTIILVFFLFIGSCSLIPTGFIGAEFMPNMDRGKFLVQFELNKDASLEQTNFITQKAENYLRNLKVKGTNKPLVESMITTVGQSTSGMGSTQATAYKSEIQLTLIDKKERSESTNVIAAKLKRELSQYLVDAKVKTVPVGMMGAEQAPIALVVTSDNVEAAQQYAEKAAGLLKTIDGATEIKLTSEAGNPEINVELDRDKMTLLGLNVATVGTTMRTAFNGNDDSKFRTGDSEYDINILFQEGNRQSIDDIENMTFINAMGQQIKLSQFATINYASGPTQLERYDKSPSVTVQAQTVGRPTGTVVSEWKTKLETLQKPANVHFTFSGDQEMQDEGFGTIFVSLFAAILLVYMVMVVLYDSFSRPFVVLFSIPLSFIGALIALALANMSLNIFTLLGMIMLIGLVAKNAIMLVDFANHRKQEGEDTVTALIQANHARLRPILMTTIAMVAGMIPLAIASSAGAEINNALAIVIIGGLLSSLFLTLIIVPLVYLIFDNISKRFGKETKVDYEKLMIADYEHREIKGEHEI